MPLEVALAVLKDVPWRIIIKITIIFSLFFSVSMTYFNMSALTSVWTSLLVSFLFSTGMTTGIHLSLRFRIAAANSVVQMFSRFGLLMLFSFTSWVTMLDALEKLVQVQADLHSQACPATEVNETSGVTSDFNQLESIIVILHYTNAVPFVLIFVYSLFYELTFEVRKEKKAENVNTEGSSLLTNILNMCRLLMSFLVGLIFAFTSALFLSKRYFFHGFLAAISSSTCRETVRNRQTAVFYYFYLVFCTIFLVLTPFSKLIPKLRASIIKKFIPAEGINNAQQQASIAQSISTVQLQQQQNQLAQSIISTFTQNQANAQPIASLQQKQPPIQLNNSASTSVQQTAPTQSHLESIQQQAAAPTQTIIEIGQHQPVQTRTELSRQVDTSIDLDFD